MNASVKHFQELLTDTTALINSEREFAAMLKWLRADSPAPCMEEWIGIEEEESKRYCERLEGFLVVLNQVHAKKHEDQDLMRNLSFLLKRITAKRALFGYKTGVSAAIEKMQTEMARQVGEPLQGNSAVSEQRVTAFRD
ncbi:MAG TPA: hypothetical protein VF490_08920 [Chryseosolibacter sp.]